MAPIGIAILGAGIFAREEHKPAVDACKDLELKAVYSKSKRSAEGLLEGLFARLQRGFYYAGKQDLIESVRVQWS